MKVLIAAAVLLLTMSAISVRGQSVEQGKDELSVWGGFAPAVRTFGPDGRTWDGKYGMIAVRYAHRWNNASWLNIKYTVDAVPAAILNYPDKRGIPTLVGPGIPAGPRFERTRETRYAFGASPFGLQFNFRPKKKLQPYFGLSLSALVFNKKTPNDTGTRLNFGSEGGVGIEYRLKDKKAVTFGYKFYHISNASRGIENPGYDSQMLYLGYTFWGK